MRHTVLQHARRAVATATTALLLPTLAVAQNQGDGIITGPDEAPTRVGTRGANFLEIGVGARGKALAGAATVATSGIEAMYWNPGALALTEGFSAAVSYSDLYKGSDISHFFAGAVLPVLGGVFGVSVNTLDSGDIPRTVEETPSGQNRNVGSTFSWNASAIGGYYARMLTDRLGVGGGLKFAQEGISESTASWVGADIGVRFETGLYGVVLGATVSNLGGSARHEGSAVTEIIDDNLQFVETGRDLQGRFVTNEMDLPTYFGFGLMLDLAGSATSLFTTDPRHRVSAMMNLRDAVDTDLQPSLGVEYSFDERIYVRGGKFWANEFVEQDFSDGLSGGFGLRVPISGRALRFDWAYTSHDLLEGTQTFSVEFGN